MNRVSMAAAAILVAAALTFGLSAQQRDATTRSADEAAVRATIDSFKKAFDRHDAAAIGDLFLPDAKIITENGTVYEGRRAIVDVFAAQFNEQPQTSIDINVESIKFIGSDLAVEIGATKVTPGPGQEPEFNRYTVVYLKRDGKWQMALARDTEGDRPTNHQRLEPLAWLVGEWIDESPEAVVETSCRWSPDGNFLMQDIQVKTAGKPVMAVNQRIGWDPVNQCIRSWVFDSEGGFGEGLWARDGDNWMIKATGVRTDGTTASATNTITRLNNDSYVWRSDDRVLAGTRGESVEVRVVRKPPSGQVK